MYIEAGLATRAPLKPGMAARKPSSPRFIVAQRSGTAMQTRRMLLASFALAAIFGLVADAAAETWPSRSVRFVAPVAAGGGLDPIARLLANRLSELWDQPVIIENKAGAGGNLAARAVAQSAPDGYTVLVGALNHAVNRYLYESAGYDLVADFTPVTLLGGFPNLMVVPNSSPARSVREFIDYAKGNRGKITYASPGAGSSVHLCGELFKRAAGIEMTHVPYRGAVTALNDLIPGRVDVYFGAVTSMLPQVQSGAVRGLAVTSATRVSLAPEIPTIAESGLPGFQMSGWYALFMPAKAPEQIVRKVLDDVVAALGHPPVKRKLEEMGLLVTPSTPAELAAMVKSEMEKWGPIINSAGIKAE